MLWQSEISYKIQKSLKCKKCDKWVTVILKANYKFCIILSIPILYYNLIELVYWAVLTWLGTRVDELHFLPSCFFLGTLHQRHISKPQGLVLPVSPLKPDYGAEESHIPTESKQWEHKATHHLPSFWTFFSKIITCPVGLRSLNQLVGSLSRI